MESRLKRVRHVRDSKLDINCHVVSYAATGIPVVFKFEHEQHVMVMDTFNDIMRDLLGVKGSTKPNLSGRATLGVDRGYLLREQLVWWLETGGDILSTIMRGLKINPFTLAKTTTKELAQMMNASRTFPRRASGQCIKKKLDTTWVCAAQRTGLLDFCFP